jgi:hypothetical protein
MKRQASMGEVGKNPITFVVAGIDIISVSGSQSYPSGPFEGPAAPITRFGRNLKVRVTRNPRIKTH